MIRITTDVFCDNCPQWIYGTISYKAKSRYARQIAKKAGWSYSTKNNNNDLCPVCKHLETLVNIERINKV